MVTGTNNTGVTLQVNGIAGGNAQVGTAVSNADGSITYTAPAVVPTPSNVVQLTITSVDNPAVSITQNISVLNPIPILTSAIAMNVQRWTRRPSCLRARKFHFRRAGAGERIAGADDLQQRNATDRDVRSDRSRAISICRF
jgi:hypothetical protein